MRVLSIAPFNNADAFNLITTLAPYVTTLSASCISDRRLAKASVIYKSKLTASTRLLFCGSKELVAPSSVCPIAFVAPIAGRKMMVGALFSTALAAPCALWLSITSAGTAMMASRAIERSRARLEYAPRIP